MSFFKILKPFGKRLKLDPFFTPHTRISSKWIRDFNAKNKNIKPIYILEENMGEFLLNLCVAKDFVIVIKMQREEK